MTLISKITARGVKECSSVANNVQQSMQKAVKLSDEINDTYVSKAVRECGAVEIKESFWNYFLPKSQRKITQIHYYKDSMQISEKSIYKGGHCVEKYKYDPNGELTYIETFNPKKDYREIKIPIAEGKYRKQIYEKGKLTYNKIVENVVEYTDDWRSGGKTLVSSEKTFEDGVLTKNIDYELELRHRVLEDYSFNPETGVMKLKEWEIHDELGTRQKVLELVKKHDKVLLKKSYEDGKLVYSETFDPKTGVTKVKEWEIGDEVGIRKLVYEGHYKDGKVIYRKDYD